MQRRDYLDKQIDQLGRALAKMLAQALGLKSGAEANIDTVNQMLQQELDIHIDDLIAAPESGFMENLQATGKFNSENFEKLADLLLVVAESDVAKSTAAYRKCLMIYESIDQSDKIYSVARQQKIKIIKTRLDG